MTLCSRPQCGGVINDMQTKVPDGNGGYQHYYCQWKNWEEHKERLMKGGQDADQVRARDRNGNLLPRK